MAELTLVRVDCRLIHGQVVVKWSKAARANKIIVIDDGVAVNDTLKTIMKMAAPANTKVLIYSQDKAVEKWSKNRFGEGNVMVMFKTIDSCYSAFRAGISFEKVQLGNCPKAEGRKPLGNEVFANEEEIRKLREMADSGVEIVIQTIPDISAIPLDKALAKL